MPNKIDSLFVWYCAGHVHVAEYLKIPLQIFFTMPWTYALWTSLPSLHPWSSWRIFGRRDERLWSTYSLEFFFANTSMMHSTVARLVLCCPPYCVIAVTRLILIWCIALDLKQTNLRISTPSVTYNQTGWFQGKWLLVFSPSAWIIVFSSQVYAPLDWRYIINWLDGDCIISCVFQLSYQVVDSMIWLGIRSIINDFRKKKLRLRPIPYLSSQGSLAEIPTGYMWSPQLVPKPDGMLQTLNFLTLL